MQRNGFHGIRHRLCGYPFPLVTAWVLLAAPWGLTSANAGEVMVPEVLDSVEAVYPEEAFAAGVEADVILEIEITEEGEVVSVEPLEIDLFEPDPDTGEWIERLLGPDEDPWGFYPAAIEALSRYRFRPARVVDEEHPEGRPIPVVVSWRVGFVIEEVEETREDEDFEEADTVVSVDEDGPVNLTGRALERGTRERIAAAVVAAERIDGEEGEGTVYVEALTDQEGRFSFRGLPPGRYVLVVEASGYERTRADEEVVAGERTQVTFFIERDVRGGVPVTRTVAAEPMRETTRRSIEVTEINRIPGNTGDAIRVVQNLPGVARASFGGGDIIVRGSAPGDTVYLIDGVFIPQLYHFGGLRAVFPTDIVESIDFYPGAFSAQYGRATGGVLQARTRAPRTDRLAGYVDTNVFDTGVFVEGPITDTLSFQVGARRSYIDALLVPFADTLGLNFTTAPRYWDSQTRLHWQPHRDHELSLLVYTSDDLLDLLLQDESGLEPDQRGGIRAQLFFQGALLRADSRLSDTVRNEFRFQGTRQRLSFSLGDDIFFNLDGLFFNVRNTTSWQASDRLTLRAGIDNQFGPAELDIRAPRPPREGEVSTGEGDDERLEVGARVATYEPAAFAELEIALLDNLVVIPGTRLEWYRSVERWALDGRLAARYALTDEWTLKAGVGTFHQAPSPDESDPTRTFGNPDLRLPWAIHYVGGVEASLSDRWELNAELFWKDLRDRVARTDAVVDTPGGPRPAIYDNAGVGRVYGLELLIRRQLTERFFGWMAYTLSRSERRDRPGEPWRVFDFDQTHILTLLGSYNLPRNWSVGGRFRLVTGNPFTPIRGGVFNPSTDDHLAVPGATNSERLGTFHQLDLRVDKRWIFDRWTLGAYLDLQNVYNRMNEEGVLYNYDFTERAAFTGLPIIPAFGLRAEF
ncbi:MAG: hypothetical protein EA398_05705 [Deltaproteobacteria bacterium]|nr:MAG: hypothetical protein EA398_05705 [Deltaproteobacteria bacterium]